MREPLFTPEAPRPVSPYSQAIVTSGRQVWVSGQLPLDPYTGTIVEGGFEVQAVRTFENLRAVVEAAGGSLSQAIKIQIYLRDTDDFAAMNEIYARYFPEPRPARTTVQTNLRMSLIEVDAVIALD